jgi:hypothetical protein
MAQLMAHLARHLAGHDELRPEVAEALAADLLWLHTSFESSTCCTVSAGSPMTRSSPS